MTRLADQSSVAGCDFIRQGGRFGQATCQRFTLGSHRAASSQAFAQPKCGQPPIDNWVCLTGILFLLKTGLPWEDFPRRLLMFLN